MFVYTKLHANIIVGSSFNPGAPLTNFNDGGGGGREGDRCSNSILYPKKSQLQNLSTQKIHYFF